MESGNPQHAPRHVDPADQLSSVTILGIAVVGALLTIGAYWLLGS